MPPNLWAKAHAYSNKTKNSTTTPTIPAPSTPEKTVKKFSTVSFSLRFGPRKKAWSITTATTYTKDKKEEENVTYISGVQYVSSNGATSGQPGHAGLDAKKGDEDGDAPSTLGDSGGEHDRTADTSGVPGSHAHVDGVSRARGSENVQSGKGASDEKERGQVAVGAAGGQQTVGDRG